MFIFILMLASTALMYYYFQRTKALEVEVAKLKSGAAGVTAASVIPPPPANASGEKPKSLLDKLRSTIGGKPRTDDEQAASPPRETPVSLQANPVTEAASLTQTGPVQTPVPAPNPTPRIDPISSVEPELATTKPAPSTAAAETIQTASPTDSTPTPTPTPKSKPTEIQSVYDVEPPPVKVKAPQRRRETR